MSYTIKGTFFKTFLEFWENFLEDFFGGMFLEEFFWKNILGGFFWEKFFGEESC